MTMAYTLTGALARPFAVARATLAMTDARFLIGGPTGVGTLPLG